MTSPITLDDIARSLERVIAPDDSIIVLHSGIWRFGHLIRPMSRDLPAKLVDCILEAIGTRTLVVPAYTVSQFPRSRVFDLHESKPETGAIPVAMMSRPGVSRTRQPMNSYLVHGSRARDILACRNSTAWGADSVMGFLNAPDVRFVTLGEVWHEACSYYHHAEELLQVPYRYYKRFSGRLLDNGQEIGTCDEVFFVKPWDVPCDDFYAGPEERLAARGLILDAEDSRFLLQSARMSDIVAVTCEILQENPYFFIRNSDVVRAWVTSGRQNEIDRLEPHQRP